MLNQKDYIKILNFYRVPIPESKASLKSTAESLLATKLCKCIVQGKDESNAIKMCTKSIFKNKGLTRGKFRCKGKRNVTSRKNSR
jgi:hypothetical protein